ncbi:TLC domain-containing protein [Citrus sinensis]|nr:TLC domain-containing protein [Citrus sinensis]
MAMSEQTVTAIKSYQNQAQVLVKNYIIADPFIPYTSILAGLLACKVVYDLTQLISTFYFKAYNGLTKIQRMEWNNRGISTVHAIFITALSLYYVFWSDLFSDQQHTGPITFRSSWLSNFGLGVSVGYFLADLGMIFWLYPSLGGMEYVVHHSLSGIAVAYSMFSGEGQLYTYMVLISEVTTPEINMRWYLDTAGMKRSTTYLVNGVIIFFAWLIARILLFVYMFYHVYLHYDQFASFKPLVASSLSTYPSTSVVNLSFSSFLFLGLAFYSSFSDLVNVTAEEETEVVEMHAIGYLLVFVVPFVLAIMNVMWFGKILKGLKKTLAKRQ